MERRKHLAPNILAGLAILGALWAGYSLASTFVNFPMIGDWRIGAIVGGILTLGSLFLYIRNLHSKINYLEEKQKPKMEMYFGDHPSCAESVIHYGNRGTLYRVGLINTGLETVEDVEVSLVKIDPPIFGNLPIRFIFMHQRDFNRVYNLNPTDTPQIFVDVVYDLHDPNKNSHEYVFQFAPNQIDGGVPMSGRIIITLQASGRNTSSLQKRYFIETNPDGKLMFGEFEDE